MKRVELVVFVVPFCEVRSQRQIELWELKVEITGTCTIKYKVNLRIKLTVTSNKR